MIDMIRRNTDYAIRLMLNLAGRFDNGLASSRTLSDEGEVSYDLTCKLLQKLCGAGLVKSQMGTKGGFALAKSPSKISLIEVVKVIQGPVSVNGCMHSVNFCSRKSSCPVSEKLGGLQGYIENYLSDITLDQLLVTNRPRKSKKG